MTEFPKHNKRGVYTKLNKSLPIGTALAMCFAIYDRDEIAGGAAPPAGGGAAWRIYATIRSNMTNLRKNGISSSSWQLGRVKCKSGERWVYEMVFCKLSVHVEWLGTSNNYHDAKQTCKIVVCDTVDFSFSKELRRDWSEFEKNSANMLDEKKYF
jgi:hypothetical protein